MYRFKLKAHKYTNVALLQFEFDTPALKIPLFTPAKKPHWFLVSYYQHIVLSYWN